MARRTRVFGIPGDLERIWALGLIRKRSKARWTRKDIERRLAQLESCIAIGAVPDARGRYLDRENGRMQWEGVAVPDGFAVYMEELREAVTVVRRALASEGIESVAGRMVGIEALVRGMCDRVNRPAIEHGLEFSPKGTDAATKEHIEKGKKRAAHVIEFARLLLVGGYGRFPSGKVNQSKLARKFLEVVKPRIKDARVRQIIRAAIRDRKLV